MKNIISFLIICLIGAAAPATAQQSKSSLDIQFTKNVLQPGDSLEVSVTYNGAAAAAQNLPLATVEVVIEAEETGRRTRLRWPVINGQATGSLYIPDSLPQGKYNLFAGLQKRFFEVVGKIQGSESIGSVQAMLLTKTGDWDEQEVPVAPNGSFTISNWLFEDNALMAFSRTGNSGRPLDIRISTQLDSAYQPLALGGRAFYIGNPSTSVRQSLNKSLNVSETLFRDEGDMLPAVVIKTVTKTPAQQFDEDYSTGLFQAGDERIISIMDNPSAQSFPNIFSYLQGRVAGLQISPTGYSSGVAMWRGAPVQFFLDEMRVSASQIASIPMADIAIVKAYPPPFFGAIGGGAGGGIAIYTRRGGEANYLPANRSVFRVKGYSPSATILNMNKLVL